MPKDNIEPIAVRRHVAAKMLGSSANRVDYLRKVGALKGVKLHARSQWLYPVADIKRLANGQPRDQWTDGRHATAVENPAPSPTSASG